MDLSIIAGAGLDKPSPAQSGLGAEAASQSSRGPMAKIIQPSFAAGELAPGLAGRVDLAKYRVGASVLENFMVLPHGGIANRPGLELISVLDGPAFLIPFVFNATQSAVLVMQDQSMTVCVDGGVVETTTGETLTPTSATDSQDDTNYYQTFEYSGSVSPSHIELPLGLASLTYSAISSASPGTSNGYYLAQAVTVAIDTSACVAATNLQYILTALPGSDDNHLLVSWSGLLGGSDTTGQANIENGVPFAIGSYGAEATFSWASGVTPVVVSGLVNFLSGPTWTVTIAVTASTPPSGNTAFAIQYSPDGATWTTLESFNVANALLSGGYIEEYDFQQPGAVSAPYWRVCWPRASGIAGAAANTTWYQLGLVSFSTPYSFADLPTLKYAQSADVMYLAHVNYPPMKLVRNSDSDWEFIPLQFLTKVASPASCSAEYNTKLNTSATTGATQPIQYEVSATDVNLNESLPCAPATAIVNVPWDATGVVEISWPAVPGASGYNIYKNSRGFYGLIGVNQVTSGGINQSSITPISGGDTGTTHPAALVFDSNPLTYWQSTVFPVTGGNAYIGADFGSPVNISDISIIQSPISKNHCLREIQVQVSADGSTWVTPSDTPAQLLPLTAGEITSIAIGPTTASQAYRYWRILAVSSLFSPWQVAQLTFNTPSGSVGNTQVFIDDNINEDAGQGPLTDSNPFVGAGNYPGAVALFQERLWWGGTLNNPQTIWASKTGLFESMASAYPIRDDDALQFTVDSKQVNQIFHMLAMYSLVLFTSGSEWAVSSSSGSGPVTPTSIDIRQQGYRGSSAYCNPIPVGYNILFVQRNDAVVREMLYNLFVNVYQTEDASILAKHLFEGYQLVQWAYQQDPYSIIWAVRNDGVLLGFTYLKEQDVWAWHHHTTNGFFQSVCSIDEGTGDDDVYVVVLRPTAGGTDTFYSLERMVSRQTQASGGGGAVNFPLGGTEIVPS